MGSASTASRLHGAPHVVTLHFRGLGRVRVSSYWLDDPEVRLVRLESSHARFGIPTDQPVAQPKPCDSSHAVAPTSGFNPTRPAGTSRCSPRRARRGRHQLLSWSSSPLRRLSPSESTRPRLTSPGTFRPQGFSPSRRITPRSDARPCFMPVTSMGFCPPGVYPHCQVPQLFAAELPSWRFSIAPADD
jgi:hypothetical protein